MNNPHEVQFRFGVQKFDEKWVGKALDGFQEDGWLSGVLYRVKGGKEARVFCYKATPAMGVDLVAAKIYRPFARPGDEKLFAISILLFCDSIHGDLSAFNILYWNGAITIIDFPQAVDPFDLSYKIIWSYCTLSVYLLHANTGLQNRDLRSNTAHPILSTPHAIQSTRGIALYQNHHPPRTNQKQ